MQHISNFFNEGDLQLYSCQGVGTSTFIFCHGLSTSTYLKQIEHWIICSSQITCVEE
jgi:hypothetical protein